MNRQSQYAKEAWSAQGGRKAEDFALAQASPDRDRYEVAVPIGAAGEGKKEKDYRLIK